MAQIITCRQDESSSISADMLGCPRLPPEVCRSLMECGCTSPGVKLISAGLWSLLLWLSRAVCDGLHLVRVGSRMSKVNTIEADTGHAVENTHSALLRTRNWSGQKRHGGTETVTAHPICVYFSVLVSLFFVFLLLFPFLLLFFYSFCMALDPGSFVDFVLHCFVFFSFLVGEGNRIPDNKPALTTESGGCCPVRGWKHCDAGIFGGDRSLGAAIPSI